jgi:hypothetical protein
MHVFHPRTTCPLPFGPNRHRALESRRIAQNKQYNGLKPILVAERCKSGPWVDRIRVALASRATWVGRRFPRWSKAPVGPLGSLRPSYPRSERLRPDGQPCPPLFVGEVLVPVGRIHPMSPVYLGGGRGRRRGDTARRGHRRCWHIGNRRCLQHIHATELQKPLRCSHRGQLQHRGKACWSDDPTCAGNHSSLGHAMNPYDCHVGWRPHEGKRQPQGGVLDWLRNSSPPPMTRLVPWPPVGSGTTPSQHRPCHDFWANKKLGVSVCPVSLCTAFIQGQHVRYPLAQNRHRVIES